MGWARKGAIAVAGVIGLGAVTVGGLVAYAAATADGKLSFPDTPEPAIRASTDPAVIEQGRYLVHGPAHCSQCHSTGEREHPEKINTVPLAGGLEFAMGPMATLYARNLTPHPTGIGELTDGQVARAVRTGVVHEGTLSIFMRYSAAQVSDEDLTAIVSYLRSMEPVDNEVHPGEFHLLGKVLVAYAFPAMTPRAVDDAPEHVPPSDEPSVERGEYLAEHVALCVLCHSQFDQTTFTSVGPRAGGGTPEPSHGADSDMEFAAPNLTSHPTGITGKLDEDAFVARIRAGRTATSSTMPWENFGAMTDADLRSVYRYLRTLPPVDNDTGPTWRKIGWTAEG